MRTKRTKLKTVTLLAILLSMSIGFVAGCKKKSEPTQQSETQEVAVAEIEQTICPVMEGNKINKDIFVEYKGKKVYFCCPSCKKKFLQNPEKYISKLPQFSK